MIDAKENEWHWYRNPSKLLVKRKLSLLHSTLASHKKMATGVPVVFAEFHRTVKVRRQNTLRACRPGNYLCPAFTAACPLASPHFRRFRPIPCLSTTLGPHGRELLRTGCHELICRIAELSIHEPHSVTKTSNEDTRPYTYLRRSQSLRNVCIVNPKTYEVLSLWRTFAVLIYFLHLWDVNTSCGFLLRLKGWRRILPTTTRIRRSSYIMTNWRHLFGFKMCFEKCPATMILVVTPKTGYWIAIQFDLCRKTISRQGYI